MHGAEAGANFTERNNASPTLINMIQLSNSSRLRLTRMAIIFAILSFFLLAAKFSQTRLTGVEPLGRVFHHLPPRSQLWGQYSPFFSASSKMPPDIPPDCEVSFVQLLSRHGSRYPTVSRSKSYDETIASIHDRTQSYSDKYSFLQLYSYSLGADDLTKFGEMEMFYSGVGFYNRYRDLARKTTPFIRASGEGRVLASAQFFSSGYHITKTNHSIPDKYPYDILVIGEYPGSNNTLNHGLCTTFETAPPPNEQYQWALKVVRPIMTRVNSNLLGADLSAIDILNLMDLCPFETVASTDGIIPPFCDLFTYEEWREYEYFQDLGKYYGYGQGNPLGPTQGVGFVNELIARLTNSSVRDRTCVNHTLDSSPSTFPLGLPIYADFSHDNDMTSIFFALGLYDSLPKYVNDPGEGCHAKEGYSASTTVPFGARAYVEKMVCAHAQEELVRIIVNDRVVNLNNCEADALGRCKLGAFVKSLRFARHGGEWDECFDT